MTAYETIASVLSGDVERCVNREDSALYQFEQFPGPGTLALYRHAQKATARARARLDTFTQNVAVETRAT